MFRTTLLAATALAAGITIGGVAFHASSVRAQAAASTNTYEQLNLFGEVFERIRDNYVEPTDDEKLIEAAVNGMLTSLDPHSSYLNQKDFQDMQVQTKGEFGGLGIEVTMEDGLIKVVSPIDDTPAAKAGIKPGDFIAAIDNAPVQGMALNDAITKMRGPAGSKITLTILRNGAKKPFDLTLTRAIVQVDSVKWRREGDVAYIRLTGFNEQTDPGLQKAVRDLKKQIGAGLKGYVLDLRNNPGGLLDQAISVSDDLLNSGEIVSTRGRHTEDTQRYDAKAGDITGGKPIVVLINGGTASASEIVAGALQDHRRATVLGMTSFGKGSVQTVIPLGEGGGALRLTTARYYTPSGHSIQARGIIPDIAVAQGEEDDQLPKVIRPSEADLPGHLLGEKGLKGDKVPPIRPAPGKKYDDFQLSYALDLLRGKVTVRAVAQNAKTQGVKAPDKSQNEKAQ
jgi:carboxyl-terminal processing protease